MGVTINENPIPSGEGLTFEKVWVMFQESIKESARETERIRKLQEETDRLMKENAERQKETDRRMKENAEQFGYLSNRFGELAEHLVVPSIMEKFNALGFTFGEVSNGKKVVDAEGKTIAEVDLLLENGDTIMVVEVKAKPDQKDVEKHINRMEILRRRADARNDKRVFLGAIAGAIMPKNVRDNILQNGFYAIEQSGDTMKINIPDNFKPRRW